MDDIISAALSRFARLTAEDTPVDLETFCSEYPASIREEIATRCRDFRRVNTLLSAIDPNNPHPNDPHPTHPDPAKLGRLGDFRLLREIGRGGMGIVYLAEELSLGRQVALKVLPFTGLLDPKKLQRFRNEASAAARLQHPNIVPVHSVGRENGVYFYAMHFVEGWSLARVIEDLKELSCSSDSTESTNWLVRDPGRGTRALYRRMAEAGAQAAEALDHAHQEGVVHRDVKPSNLLVDETGHLWITDFGLAKLESRSELTLSGDLLGTLAYMSPEQAEGKRFVDHRADIYGLGASLYELITLKPSFSAESRAALLRRVVNEDPVPPSRIRSDLPVEIDAILGKAMAKDPQERYSSARELALDLRRFVEDRPILARPPSLRVRCKRWARRHQRLVLSISSVLIVAVISLAVGTVLLWKERSNTSAALAEARENFRLARNAVDRLLTRVGDESLESIPQMDPVRLAVLQDSLLYYEKFVERDQDPEVIRDLVVLLGRVARIQAQLDRVEDAESTLRRAMTWVKDEQVRDDEDVFRPGFELEGTELVLQLARIVERRGDPIAGLEMFRRAYALYGELRAVSPEYETRFLDGRIVAGAQLVSVLLSRMEVNEARTLSESVLEESRDMIARFPNNSRARELLLISLRRHAAVLEAAQDYAGAQTIYCEALDAWEELTEAQLRDRDNRVQFCELSAGWGQILVSQGQADKALEVTRRAVDMRRQLVADFPAQTGYSLGLAGDLQNLALCLKNLDSDASPDNRPEDRDALVPLNEAEKICRRLIETAPQDIQAAEALPNILLNRGRILLARGRSQEAFSDLRESCSLFEGLCSELPENVAIRERLAFEMLHLGLYLLDENEAEEAIPRIERSYTLARERFEEGKRRGESHPLEWARVMHLQSLSSSTLTRWYGDRGDLETALLWANRRVEAGRDLEAKPPSPDPYSLFLSAGLFQKAEVLIKQQRWRQAHDHYLEAVEIQESTSPEDATRFHTWVMFAQTQLGLARSLFELGDLAGARDRCREAIELCETVRSRKIRGNGFEKTYREICEIACGAILLDSEELRRPTSLDIARAHAQKAAELRPTFDNPWSVLTADTVRAAFLLREGRRGEAEEILDSVESSLESESDSRNWSRIVERLRTSIAPTTDDR